MVTNHSWRCRRTSSRVLDRHWLNGAPNHVLLAGVRRRLGCTTLHAAQLVRVVLALIVEALRQGQRVSLPGLGVWRVAPGHPHTWWDPVARHLVRTPRPNVVRFRPAPGLLPGPHPPCALSASTGPSNPCPGEHHE